MEFPIYGYIETYTGKKLLIPEMPNANGGRYIPNEGIGLFNCSFMCSRLPASSSETWPINAGWPPDWRANAYGSIDKIFENLIFSSENNTFYQISTTRLPGNTAYFTFYEDSEIAQGNKNYDMVYASGNDIINYIAKDFWFFGSVNGTIYLFYWQAQNPTGLEIVHYIYPASSGLSVRVFGANQWGEGVTIHLGEPPPDPPDPSEIDPGPGPPGTWIPDPHAPGGGFVKPGGGTGDFDGTETPIPTPGIPEQNLTDTSFVRLYTPSKTQLNSLASYMWSDVFDSNSLRKLFSNPMDVILGLSIIPTIIPSGRIGGVILGGIDSGISMNIPDNQYVIFDCGGQQLNEFWGSYLDYAPYTKVSIYLPFIGTRELNADDVMGKLVSVQYHIDILSGACVAIITVASGGVSTVMYQFAGSCATPVPISGNDWSNTITSVIQLAGAGIVASVPGLGAVGAAGLATSAVNTAMAAKPSISRSGAVSGAAGNLGVRTPYLIIERPRQALAEYYNAYAGYPANFTAVIGQLSGFTKIEEVVLDEIIATESELQEIEALLKSGVLI